MVVFLDVRVLESRKLVDCQYNCCIRYQKTPYALKLALLNRQAGLYNAWFDAPEKFAQEQNHAELIDPNIAAANIRPATG